MIPNPPPLHDSAAYLDVRSSVPVIHDLARRADLARDASSFDGPTMVTITEACEKYGRSLVTFLSTAEIRRFAAVLATLTSEATDRAARSAGPASLGARLADVGLAVDAVLATRTD